MNNCEIAMAERELPKYYRIRRMMKDSEDYELMDGMWRISTSIKKYEKICGKKEVDFLIEAL